MAGPSIVNRRYTYSNDWKWPAEAVDVHHVAVRRSKAKAFAACFPALIFLSNSIYRFLLKESSISFLLWSFGLAAVVVRLILWKPVVKESVVILPAFGVQLETHHMSGNIVRSFIPFGKILKPVLLERVTPVTCYWYLSLILRDEEELMLVFKELRPPLEMLIPIWKALCAAAGSKESSHTLQNMVNWEEGF